MSAADWLSVAVILVAMYALYCQLRILRTTLSVRRFAQVATLIYFIAINLAALTTTDLYVIRSGILSKIGVLILLVTVILDKGDC